MNQDNYASLEASKRLDAAGIVFETEAVWFIPHNEEPPFLGLADGIRLETKWQYTTIPAPSMAEVWRELPEGYTYFCFKFGDNLLQVSSADSPHFRSTNPTDALIDLLIWVRQNAT